MGKFKTIAKLATSRPRGWKSLLWNTAMARMGRPGPLMAPVHVSIEPTNLCNAKCSVCETGNGQMNRVKGLLDLESFKAFIDKNYKTTNSLMFYFMGEPFLNKNAYEMVRYARSKNIYVDTCTNGDFVDPEGVIYSDINQISFQLGGMTQETHHRYRVNTYLDKSIPKLMELIELRKKHPETNVKIDVGFIVMRHNEHEVEDFLKWAEEIGVDTANVVDPCARNMFEARAYLPKDRKYWYYDENAFENGVLRPKVLPNNSCEWIWNSVQLNWNGEAVPCCRDPLGKHVFGNVFEEGLVGVFNNEKATDFRRRILTDQANVDICKLCSGYGLPNLVKPTRGEFSVVRHSVNVEGIEDALMEATEKE